MKRNCSAARGLVALVLPFGFAAVLAARCATPSAFERRCIPSPPQRGCRVGDPGPGGVAPPSNTPGTPGILGRRALPVGRIAHSASSGGRALTSGTLLGSRRRRLCADRRITARRIARSVLALAAGPHAHDGDDGEKTRADSHEDRVD